jgi:hypothetical protein
MMMDSVDNCEKVSDDGAMDGTLKVASELVKDFDRLAVDVSEMRSKLQNLAEGLLRYGRPVPTPENPLVTQVTKYGRTEKESVDSRPRVSGVSAKRGGDQSKE